MELESVIERAQQMILCAQEMIIGDPNMNYETEGIIRGNIKTILQSFSEIPLLSHFQKSTLETPDQLPASTDGVQSLSPVIEQSRKEVTLELESIVERLRKAIDSVKQLVSGASNINTETEEAIKDQMEEFIHKLLLDTPVQSSTEGVHSENQVTEDVRIENQATEIVQSCTVTEDVHENQAEETVQSCTVTEDVRIENQAMEIVQSCTVTEDVHENQAENTVQSCTVTEDVHENQAKETAQSSTVAERDHNGNQAMEPVHSGSVTEGVHNENQAVVPLHSDVKKELLSNIKRVKKLIDCVQQMITSDPNITNETEVTSNEKIKDVLQAFSEIPQLSLEVQKINLDTSDQDPSSCVAVQTEDGTLKQLLSAHTARFDPFKMSLPKRVIMNDCKSTDIRCLVTDSSSENLFAIDHMNKTIKVFSLRSSLCISTLSLEFTPLVVTSVTEKQLAVTTKEKIILLIDVSDISKMKTQKKILPRRYYFGITSVNTHDNDTALLACCDRDGKEPASVDKMSLTGEHIKTVISSKTLHDLLWPWHLHADTERDVLLISDCGSHCVFRVQLSSGYVLDQVKFPRIASSPSQVCTDSAGNIYVACPGTQSVQVTPARGKYWREILTGKGESEGIHVCPLGVCVTNTGLVVSWNGGMVKRYDYVI